MGDYQRDTNHLSLMEHGAYTVLLDHYYSRRKPLPAQIDGLYRLCRAIGKHEQAAVKTVAEEFFPLGRDGHRHNERADAEIEKWEEMAQENRERGKLGGRPRKNPTGKPNGYRNANQSGYGNETQPVTQPVRFTEPAENPLQIQNPDLEEELRNKIPDSASREPEISDPNPPEPDLDPEAYLVWTSGLAYLGGEPKRSLLGKLVKQYGRGRVATKLGELMRMDEPPQDPTGYLVACMHKFDRGVVC